MRKRTVFISFFTSCTQPCPSDLSAHIHPVCVRALWLTLHWHGASASTLDGGRVWSVVLTQLRGIFLLEDAHCHRSCRFWTVYSRIMMTSFKQTRCVCALRSLGHGCVQEVKNDINTVRFLTQTARFVSLGHQCVVTMGNCLIWISLCMFFFPLIETVTYTCHYMTDRLERFDLKTSNWIYWRKKDTYILDCPSGKLIDTKF